MALTVKNSVPSDLIESCPGQPLINTLLNKAGKKWMFLLCSETQGLGWLLDRLSSTQSERSETNAHQAAFFKHEPLEVI